MDELEEFVCKMDEKISNRISSLDNRLKRMAEELEDIKNSKDKDFRKIILTERLDWRSINIYQTTLSSEFKEQYKVLFKYYFEAADKDDN